MVKENKHGFTLIEIIVVIVILAVLMAVAVPSVLSYVHTADDAPALTECYAIVTAAQKRVVDKYSQSKNNNISLNQSDKTWIEEFVNEGGEIQGNITVSNKEVTRVLYLTSNGLYVLYENQEYRIVDEDELKNDMFTQFNQMIIDYTKLTKDLIGNQTYLDRHEPIQALIDAGKLVEVDKKITQAALENTKTSLYWRPYYLGSVKNPQLIMYANTDKKKKNWDSQIMYVNGKIYKTIDFKDNKQSHHNIASYYKDFSTIEELEAEISNHPEKYIPIEVE